MSDIFRFKDMVGNKSTISLIKKALSKKSFPNVAIFSGNIGTGKSTSSIVCGLYLTCENPSEGEPCLKCPTCISNMKAVKSNGVGMGLVSKNLGTLDSKQDIKDLIREIFTLQTSFGNSVYRLEEAHSLSSEQQTALLEEIDRISPSTYVILTTSKPFKLLPEIRSRAISYNFNRLNDSESLELVHKNLKEFNINSVSESTINLILSYTKGIPRDISNIVDFVIKTEPTEEEVRSFLGKIDSKSIEFLFNTVANLKSYLSYLKVLTSSYSYEVIIKNLQDFVLNCYYEIEGTVSTELSKEGIDTKSIFQNCNLDKIIDLVFKMNIGCSENEFMFNMIKLRQLILNKKISSIVSDNSVNVNTQKERARIAFNENSSIELESSEVLKPINNTNFMGIFNESTSKKRT